MKIIIDAHEDLACAMLGMGRNYLRSVAETRELENATPHFTMANGQTLIGWPEYQKGQVAVVFGTLFASPKKWQRHDWDTQTFSTPDEAHVLNIKQIEVYQRLNDEHPEAFHLVTDQGELKNILEPWISTLASYPDVTHPVGVVILMEGADGVRSEADLEEFWKLGVRIIGPVWAGNRFCGGTREPGPLTGEGKKLLKSMAKIGFTLDISHMSQVPVLEALDLYEGQVIASHANANALLKNMPFERHLTDEAIHRLVERDGVMGIIPFNAFLDWEWKSGNPRESVRLEQLIRHIDHICQIAGDARHVAIGSDFDGGFGWPDVPYEIDTIADLQKLENPLLEKGYNDENVTAILAGNWQRKLESILSE
jgi:membrane dipeptidase